MIAVSPLKYVQLFLLEFFNWTQIFQIQIKVVFIEHFKAKQNIQVSNPIY